MAYGLWLYGCMAEWLMAEWLMAYGCMAEWLMAVWLYGLWLYGCMAVFPYLSLCYYIKSEICGNMYLQGRKLTLCNNK